MSRTEIVQYIDRADLIADRLARENQPPGTLPGHLLISLFFENSTRTRASFQIAGQRLGFNVVDMSLATSSTGKGETLLDTAMTLNAMRPDVLVVRHAMSGVPHLLSHKVNCLSSRRRESRTSNQALNRCPHRSGAQGTSMPSRVSCGASAQRWRASNIPC